MNITVLGAGAWGTALAASAARASSGPGDTKSNTVLLWARDPLQADTIVRTRRNTRYLRDVELPASLAVTADFSAALAHGRSGLYVIGTPMAALGDMLQALPEDAAVIWLCKGFQAGTGWLGHEVARSVRPQARVGVLSGPSFADEVLQGLPTALVSASGDAAVRQLAVDAFHSETLRVYTSTDPIGVEVGGAVKNVLAIATGIADGMGLGLNARAALITRGLVEMTRLGVALGAQAETFTGLSGLGDLVLTATGDLSRNRKVGLQLAKGLNLQQILSELGHVSEGVYSAATVLARANSLNVDMPITAAVVAVIEGRLSPVQGLLQLMRREARAEG